MAETKRRGKDSAATKDQAPAKGKAPAAAARTPAKAASAPAVFGYTPGGGAWLRRTASPAQLGRPTGEAIYIGVGTDPRAALTKLGLDLPAWLVEKLLRRRGEVTLVASGERPVWLLLATPKPEIKGHGGLLDYSPYGVGRDLAALLPTAINDYALGALSVRFVSAKPEEQLGVLVGLELGAYRYRSVRQPGSVAELPVLAVDAGEALVEEAVALASGVNLARHLVNVPAGELNPASYAAALTELFAGSKAMSVEVWDGARLADERMGLLRAVGQGATFGPALVRLSYRPKGKKAKPVAFVGKGITFDTGGLDIKDAGSMRMMKKDMGGSASLAGLAYWVEASGLDVPCDFYLALAENSVDKDAFHPGDVLTARSGTTVEIDNTDAEGRLVLADALDVATKAQGADAPELVIDLATLTGAMRVALGTRLAGMFATDDGLAKGLLAAAQRRADPVWRMPLFLDYLVGLKSVVADLANSGPNRFGGGITAALFLQRFVGAGIPWAHFDMYGWTDANIGGCAEMGGNGQCVQLLSEFLRSWNR